MRALCLGALGCALMVAQPAAAEPERPWRAALKAGGYFAATGPADHGGQVVVTGSPGGAWGRFAVRASARSLERDEGVFALGLSFEAAASRPRLAIELFAEAGATTDGTVVVGAGVHSTLWVIGPLALGSEGAAHIFADGLDSSLALTAVLCVGLAR